MRAILVDWLLDVALVYRLPSQTFHIACLVLDHYVGSEGGELKRNDLQLVGCGALLVGACYEACRDVARITAEDLAHMTDDSYTVEQVRDMALTIGNSPVVPSLTLLCPITSHAFLEGIVAGLHPVVSSMAHFVLELSVVYQCGDYTAATTAVGALLVALHWLRIDEGDNRNFFRDAAQPAWRCSPRRAPAAPTGRLEEQLPRHLANQVRDLCRHDRLMLSGCGVVPGEGKGAQATADPTRQWESRPPRPPTPPPQRRSPRLSGGGNGGGGAVGPDGPAAEAGEARPAEGLPSAETTLQMATPTGVTTAEDARGAPVASSSVTPPPPSPESISSEADGGSADEAVSTPTATGELRPMFDCAALCECVASMAELLRHERTKPSLAAVREKFSEPRYHTVAVLAMNAREAQWRGNAKARDKHARLLVDAKLAPVPT